MNDLGTLILGFAGDTSDLERAFRDMRRQAQSVARDIDRSINGVNGKGIKVKFDYSEANKFAAQVNRQQRQSTRNSQRKEADQPIKVKLDTGNFDKAVDRITGKQKGVFSRIGDSITTPLKAVGNTAGKVLTGALEGVGRPLGEDIGEGIKEGIQRETGDIVGSFRLVSREIGAAVSQGIVESLGQDANQIKSAFEAVLGKQVVAVEAAAQRQKASQQRRSTQRQAGQQIQREFEFVRANMPAIKERGQSLQSQRQQLSQKQQALQGKIAETADSMGAGQLNKRLESLREQRNQITEQMASAEDVNAIDQYQNQLKRLAESYENTESAIESIHKRATDRHRALSDKLAEESDNLLQQERSFGKLISPIETIDYVQAPKLSQRSKPKASSSAQLPALYQQIAQEVGKASGMQLDASNMPGLVANPGMEKGVHGMYLPKSNQIAVPPEMLEAIKSGNLSGKQIETLVHELRHGAQFGFGQKNAESIATGQSSPAVQLLKPVAEELKEFRRNIEGSVRASAPENQGTSRKLEADAYTFAARNTQSIQAKVLQSARVAKFEQSVGIGGAKAETLFKQSQLQSLKKLQGIKGMIPELGLDESTIQELEQNFSQTVDAIYGLDSNLEKVLEQAANIELLPIEQIDELEQSLLGQVAKLSQVANQYSQDFFEQIKAAKSNQQKPSAPIAAAEPGGASFADTLKQEFTAKGLREVAGKLNIGGMGSANKDALVQAIAVAREHRQAEVEQVMKHLGDSIRKKSTATGQAKSLQKLTNFNEVKAGLKTTDQEIRQAMEILSTAQGQERKELLEAIVSEIDKQVTWIDELTSTYDVGGKERQSLAAYRNLFTTSRGKPNAELMNIRTAEINQLSNKTGATSGYVQSVSSMRGNSMEGYHSVADIQEEIDKLFQSAKGSYDSGNVAYHSVADIQEEIQKLIEGVKIRLKPDAPSSISMSELEANTGGSVNPGSVPLPNGNEAEVVVRLRNTLDEFEQAENQINQRFGASSQEVEATLAGLGDSSETLVSRLKRVFKTFQTDGLFEGFKAAKANIGGFLKALLGLNAIQSIIGIINDFSPVLIDAAMAMESLERRVSFTSSSLADGAKNFAWLRSEAQRLGVDVKQMSEGFVGLAASTKGTALEGKEQLITGSLAQASAVYGLDAQQQERAFTALSQVASKGKLSAEELRGQLSEALPGAFQVAARAMGVTSAELNKMLELGQVTSEDFLPKFAQQLASETAGGVAGAANSSKAALNRFNNTVFETQAALGKGLLPARNAGLEILTSGLQFAAQNADILVQVVKFLALYMMGTAAKSVFVFVSGLKLMGGQALLSVGGLKALAVASRGLLVSMSPMVAMFVGFQIVSEIFDKIKFSFSDAGGSVRDFANTSKQGLNQFKRALAEVRGEQEKLDSSLPSRPQLNRQAREKEAKNSTILNTFGIAGTIADVIKSPFRKDSDVAKQLGRSPDSKVSLGDRLKAPFARVGDVFKPKDVKILDDKVAATNDALANVRGLVGASQSKEIQDVVGQVKALDKQLEAVQIRRRGLVQTNPSDTEGLKQLKAEEDAILKDRERAIKPVGVMQSQLDQQVQGLKKTLEEYDQMASEGTIDQNTYAQKTGEIKKELESAEKAQEAFNKSIGDSVNSFTLLQKNIQGVADRLADAGDKLSIGTNAAKASLYEGQASGNLTEGEVQFGSSQIELQALQQQIEDKLQALKETQALLNTDENQVRLDAFGVTPDMGQAQIKTLAEGAKSDEDKFVLEQYANVQAQQLEISDLQAQSAQARAEAQQRLIDLNKQVEEYYRGIERQTQELAIATKQAEIQLANQAQTNRLKTALLGIKSNIVGQFVDSILAATGKLSEASGAALDAQSKILSNKFQFQDTVKSGNDLKRQLPGATYQGSNAPSIPVKLDLSSVAKDTNLSKVNNEIKKATSSTRDLNSATNAYNKTVDSAEKNLKDNTGATKSLTSAVGGAKNAAGQLNSQINQNSVALDKNIVTAQNLTISFGENGSAIEANKQKSTEWWNSLTPMEQLTISIQTIFAGIGDAIGKAMDKSAEWLKGLAANIPFLQGIGQIIGGWGQGLQSAQSGVGESLVGGAQGLLNQMGTGGVSVSASGGGRVTENYRTGTLAAQEYGAKRPGRKHAGQDIDISGNQQAQSFLGGTVTRVVINPNGKGYGSYVDIFNKQLGVVERIAEMVNVNVKVGQQIAAGQSVGGGESRTGVFHYEVRKDVNAQGQGGFGYEGTVDPIKYYEQMGLVKRQGQRLVITGGINAGQTVNEKPHALGDGHNHFGEEDVKKANQQAVKQQVSGGGTLPQLRQGYGSVAKLGESFAGNAAFNPNSPEGRARLALVMATGGSEVYSKGSTATDFFTRRGGTGNNMLGALQYNMAYHKDKVDTPQEYVNFSGEIFSGRRALPNGRRGQDFGAALTQAISSGQVQTGAQLEQWMRKVGLGGSNWQGVDDGFRRVPGLTDDLVAWLKTGQGKPATSGVASTAPEVAPANIPGFVPFGSAAAPSGSQMQDRVSQAQSQAAANQQRQDALVSAQAKAQANTDAIAALESGYAARDELIRGLRDSNKETTGIVNEFNDVVNQFKPPQGIEGDFANQRRDLERSFTDIRDRLTDQISNVRARTDSATRLLGMGDIIGEDQRSQIQQLIGSGQLDPKVAEELKKAMDSGVFGAETRRLLQQSADQGKAELATLESKLKEVDSKKTEALKNVDDAFNRAKKLQQQQEDFSKREASIANLQTQIEQVQAIAQTNPTGEEAKRLPTLQQELGALQAQLDYDRKIAEIEEQRYNKTLTDSGANELVAKAKEELETKTKTLGIVKEQAEAEQRIAESRAKLEKRQFTADIFSQLSEGMAKSAELGLSQGDPLQMRYGLQTQGQELQLEQQLLGLQEMAAAGKLTKEEVDNLTEAYNRLNGISLANLKAEYERSVQDRQLAIDAQMVGSDVAVLQAQSQGLSTMGLGMQAKQKDKQIAVMQQGLNFRQQSVELERFIQQNQVAADAAARLRSNLQQVNEISLDNIQKQFDPMTEVLGGIQGSFKTFFSDLISGSKSFGEAFNGLIDSIVGNLANMAAEWLSNELFGELFGGKGEGIGSTGGFAGAPEQQPVAANNIMPFNPTGFAQGVTLGTNPMQPMYVSDVSQAPLGGVANTNLFGSSNILDGMSKGSFFSGVQMKPLAVDMVSASNNVFDPITQGFSGVMQGLGGLFGGGGGGMGSGIGSLVGSLVGGGGMGGGGGFGNIISTGLSLVSSIFGFAHGGIAGIDGLKTPIANYAKGGLAGFFQSAAASGGLRAAMGRAAQKEKSMNGGRGVVPAMLTEGERVLTVQQNRRFEQLGGARILNFAKGGVVGGFAQSVAEKTQNSVSVSVPVNISGGESSGVDPSRFREVIDAKIRQVIREESRQGGSLRKR